MYRFAQPNSGDRLTERWRKTPNGGEQQQLLKCIGFVEIVKPVEADFCINDFFGHFLACSEIHFVQWRTTAVADMCRFRSTERWRSLNRTVAKNTERWRITAVPEMYGLRGNRDDC